MNEDLKPEVGQEAVNLDGGVAETVVKVEEPAAVEPKKGAKTTKKETETAKEVTTKTKKTASKAEKASKEDKEESKEKVEVVEAEKESDVKKPETPVETAQSLLAPDNAIDGLKIRRAKGSKNISVGVCHILATFNNTKVAFSDPKGNVIAWSSAGRCNFKGSRKSTAYAAQVVTTEAAKVAMGHGLREVAIEVKGPGMGRDSAIRTLQTLGLGILSIKDVTPVPHNGCRPPKPRRV